MGLQYFLSQMIKYPKPQAFQPSYGTSGFRAEASLLPSTIHRCGALMAMRSIITGKVCGLMLTASHNPAADNGVKLIEPTGDMLNPAWEQLADALARASSDAEVTDIVSSIMRDASPSPANAVVLLACDTRASADALCEAAQNGITAMNAKVVHLGRLTTPQLHWIVNARNRGLPDTLSAYYDALLDNFLTLTKDFPGDSSPLIVDCANGVGAQHLGAMKGRLASLGLEVDLRNVGSGELNHLCGSDFVEKARQVPATFTQEEVRGARCVQPLRLLLLRLLRTCMILPPASRGVSPAPGTPCTPPRHSSLPHTARR
jgi:phosphoacetylglucosamine mutase